MSNAELCKPFEERHTKQLYVICIFLLIIIIAVYVLHMADIMIKMAIEIMCDFTAC